MRTRLSVAAVLTIGLLSITLVGADNPKEAVEKTVNAHVLADRLQQIVTIQNEIPETPLIEVLEFLNDKYDLNIQVSPEFTSPGGGMAAENQDRNLVRLNVAENPILVERVTVRKMKSVRLETVLRQVCQQIQGTYLILPDQISIVSVQSLPYLIGQGEEDPPQFVTLPLVTMKIEGKPLSQVLNELSERSNTTILLAPQSADAAKLSISAKLLNTPIDRAISLLAEMGELRMVRKGNAYLVTSVGKAKELEPKFAEFGQAGPVQGGIDGNGLGFRRQLRAERANEETNKKIDELTQKLAELEKKLGEKK